MILRVTAIYSLCDRKRFSVWPQMIFSVTTNDSPSDSKQGVFYPRFTALGRGFGGGGAVVWQMWQQKNNNPGVNTRAREAMQQDAHKKMKDDRTLDFILRFLAMA